MTLLTPLCPLAEPPNLTERDMGLCWRESWMTISELGTRAVCRRAVATAGPVTFMRGFGLKRVRSTEESPRTMRERPV